MAIKTRIVDHIKNNQLLFNTNRKTFLPTKETCSKYTNSRRFNAIANSALRRRKKLEITVKEPTGNNKQDRSASDENCSCGENTFSPDQKKLNFFSRSQKKLISHSRSSLRLLKRPFAQRRQTTTIKQTDHKTRSTTKSLFSTTKTIFLLPTCTQQLQPVTITTKKLSEFLPKKRGNLSGITSKKSKRKFVDTIKANKYTDFLVKSRRDKLAVSCRGGKEEEFQSDCPIVWLELIEGAIKMPSGGADSALVVDNKDGTVKFSYNPKETGQHELSVRYNDEPLQECPLTFYVDVIGSAKKKITGKLSSFNVFIYSIKCTCTKI